MAVTSMQQLSLFLACVSTVSLFCVVLNSSVGNIAVQRQRQDRHRQEGGRPEEENQEIATTTGTSRQQNHDRQEASNSRDDDHSSHNKEEILHHQRRDEGSTLSSRSSNDMNIFYMPTIRNRNIMSDAVGLHIRPWGFRNRHFASMLAQVRPSPFLFHRNIAKRQMQKIMSPSGCYIEVEFIEPRSKFFDDTPIIILLHGIGGSSREAYVEQTALQIIKKGWRVVVLNYSKLCIVGSASVGGNCLTESHDINFLVSHIRNYHSGFLAIIGFSMGGNKVSQYLLRTKEHCNVDAACTISSPLDFSVNNHTVHEPHQSFMSTFYHLVVSSHLKLWILKHYHILQKHHLIQSAGPFTRSRSSFLFWFTCWSVPEIDRAITMPLKGRRESDLLTYYNEASSLHHLGDGIMIPFLCISALNDPFIPSRVIPGKALADANPNIFIVNTKYGGHIGYWMPEVGCWASNCAISFFNSVQKHIGRKPDAHSRYLRQASSLDAAYCLQKSSHTGLTHYFDFVDLDSCSNLLMQDNS